MYNVLIVDDEPYIRQGLKIIIPWEDYGFCVKGEASNGEEAILLLNEGGYDLIISDIKMPKITGLELMEYTWRNISTQVRCILLSGYYEFEYAKKAIKYEAANYLLKPVEKSELIQALMEFKEQMVKNNNTKDENIEKSYRLEKDILDEVIRDIEEQKYESLEKRIEELYYLFKYNIREKEIVQMHMDYLFMSLIDIIKTLSKEDEREEVNEILRSTGFYCISDNESIVYLKRFVIEMSVYMGNIRKKALGGVLKEVLKDIHNNYNKPLSLKNLSEKYFINSAYLGQIFKKQYHISFKDYLNNYRIERAAELLKRTDTMVGDISYMVGFNSTDYFISKFVEVYKLTPLQYRKQMMSIK